MRTSKQPSGKFQTTKSSKMVIFKGDGSLDSLLSRLLERHKLFWTSHMSGYLIEPNRDNENFKGAVRNVRNCQIGPKWQKGILQRIWQSLSACQWGTPNIKINAERLLCPLKIILFAVFDSADCFVEVLIISNWFHKVPWNMSESRTLSVSPIALKSVQDCWLL